ncbi:xanthine dehydrogenase family protein molybdopterin-binding subunit [Tautonia rosea]|uniref:xanthine dehydrogenase family protein molybdopterin-binding subunit n=1 Tax=Tautonia rosea TaxID=2728037 RepID=UPI001474ABBF|nr:molybdopterin cofactor-binding domain-containing protein [Tautonia rosea]
MNRNTDHPTFGELEFELEPERYELLSGLASIELDRRDFLRSLGGGLVVLCLLGRAEAQEARRGRGQSGGGSGAEPREIGAWLQIGEDGGITAFTGKVEVGQNARTSLSQAVADELRVPVDAVAMVMGDTDRVPYDRGTFGSRTTPTMAPQLRRAASAARSILVGLAAEQWGVDRSEIELAEGALTHPPSGRSIGFGELTHGRRLVEAIEEDDTPRPRDRWEVAGQDAPKANGRDFVTGRHQYASDIDRPGMLRGKVLRPPAFGAALKPGVDASNAEAVDGVMVVRDGDFIGVVAPDEPMAERALEAIRAEWTMPEGDLPTHQTLYDHFKRTAEDRRGRDDSGPLAQALSKADAVIEASYTIAPIAHAPLEPRAAVAEWDGDRLTVWTGTQRPFGVREELMAAFGLAEDQVRVIVPDTGSGYGGKHTGDAAVEAARLARAVGRPVKLVWTRSEEFTWAYFRPAGLIEARAGAAKDGTLSAWEFTNYNSGGSGIEPPYAIAERDIAFIRADSPLRQGSYRALAATANHFARESIIDELAHALGMDPLDFRRKNLNQDRVRAVLDAAAERFGWEGANVEPGHGIGLACGMEKGGHVASCAEVAVDDSGRVEIVRTVTAFECGAIVNPLHLTNQVSGSVVQGIGGALFEAITFENGRILNDRFSRYRVPRLSDVFDRVEVVLVDRSDLPSAGGGETPIVAIAPAFGNAIFAATGRRIRALPLAPGGRLPEV